MATSVDWCYCDNLSFEIKHAVACKMWYEGRTTVPELEELINRSDESIRNALDILVAEGVVKRYRAGRKRVYTNEGIGEVYILRLESVITKYEGSYRQNDSSSMDSVNIERTSI